MKEYYKKWYQELLKINDDNMKTWTKPYFLFDEICDIMIVAKESNEDSYKYPNDFETIYADCKKAKEDYKKKPSKTDTIWKIADKLSFVFQGKIVINNLVKISYNGKAGKHPKEQFLIKIDNKGILQHEIETLQPKVIVFLCGSYKNIIENYLDIKIDGVLNSRNPIGIEFRYNNIPCLLNCHPGARLTEENREIYNNNIIEFIKKQNLQALHASEN